MYGILHQASDSTHKLSFARTTATFRLPLAMVFKVSIFLLACLTLSLPIVGAGFGGSQCNIPAIGSPGATTVCTADTNGFCLIDHLTVTGPAPITSITYDGVCICYYGFSGPSCATMASSASFPNTPTVVAAVTLAGAGAYFLGQLGTGEIPFVLGSPQTTFF
uniref:EGF-like domain-containing protein n=1 Tax=Magallana gigas TaxID=29159 RepID=A0A8W8LHD9_MAGGI